MFRSSCIWLWLLTFCITFGSQNHTFAQPYPIGSTTLTFNDPSRTGGFGSGGGSGRQIQTEIYYPATSVGINAVVAEGRFPLIVFGHGFLMAWSAYQNLWTDLVPRGYILAFPRTEGGASPGHNQFALDFRVINERMTALDTTPGSLFFNKLNGKSAFAGHSMGGGAATLAAANYTWVDAVVLMAPAETNPSAIAAAASINKPTLVLSGSRDGVTPPAQHHIPIYTALGNSVCNTFVSLVGGAHCYFANANLPCDIGEGTSSTGITLTRIQQQNSAQTLTAAWLNRFLFNQCAGLQQFNNAIAQTSYLSTQANCSLSVLQVEATITPQTSAFLGAISLTINGEQAPYTLLWNTGSTEQSISGLIAGNYQVEINTASGCSISYSYVVPLSTQLKEIGFDNEIPHVVIWRTLDGKILNQQPNKSGVFVKEAHFTDRIVRSKWAIFK